MRVLITSFGPFPGVDNNSSQLLMTKISEIYSENGIDINYEVLETSYNFCLKWIEKFPIEKYDLIIHLGVAIKAKKIRLEKYARNNVCPNSKDFSGNEWGESIIYHNTLQRFKTEIELSEVLSQLNTLRNHVYISNNAGDYLCNFIYYLTNYKKDILFLKTKILFIHLPDIRKKSSANIETQLIVFKKILTAIIKQIKEN